MQYKEAMKAQVTRAEAKKEIEEHNLNFYDFVIDCGDKEFYIGSEVLNWLGY